MKCSEVLRQVFWAAFGISFLLVVGCSTKNAAVSPTAAAAPSPIAVECVDGFRWPDSNLSMRFQQYWSNRKAGNAVGAFEYEAPHIKEMIVWGKYERFSKTARPDWLLVRVEKINRITEQLVEIDFNMIAKNKDREGALRDIFFRDSWLLLSGQWYHALKDPFVTGDGLGK